MLLTFSLLPVVPIIFHSKSYCFVAYCCQHIICCIAKHFFHLWKKSNIKLFMCIMLCGAACCPRNLLFSMHYSIPWCSYLRILDINDLYVICCIVQLILVHVLMCRPDLHFEDNWKIITKGKEVYAAYIYLSICLAAFPL